MNDDLLLQLASFEDDPVGFVKWAFPWGEPDSELRNRPGPEPWQLDQQIYIRDQLRSNQLVILDATASGHGIGKSAEASWMILWALTTMANTKGVVTANTEKQLRTKTWSELSKWYGMFIAKDLFELDATCLKVRSPEVEEKSKWKVDMVPWSERNVESFQGMHNLGRRVIMLMDEASAIPDIIHEACEGVLTDQNTQIIWLMYGNPTRSSGRFFSSFKGNFAHRWHTRQVDSRIVSFTNKRKIEEWIEDYGDDSDFVRVRVKGEFPRVDAESFISYTEATDAIDRDVKVHSSEPLILGVDVGRFGDDPSVIAPRRGRDASSIEWELIPSADTMEVAARVAATFLRTHANMVMIDSGGVGGGVADRLRMLRIPVIDVEFGSNPAFQNGIKYANKRAEIWGDMREWLRGGSIPAQIRGAETPLVDELCGPRFGLNKAEEILLESKKDMRSRGVPSPNCADALACTFAYPVYVPYKEDEKVPEIAPDYNPYALERMRDGIFSS